MWKSQVTFEETIAFLNELIALDPEAMRALVEHHVPANQGLVDHPTVQVSGYDGAPPKVGLLGILNGLFGTDEEGWGVISALFEDDGRLVKFMRTVHKNARAPAAP